MKRILLDGKYETTGDIETVLQIYLADDPDFDASRLTYHPDDVRAEKHKAVKEYGAQVRNTLVSEPDVLRRQGQLMKGATAMMVIAVTQPDVFTSQIVPQALAAFKEEAARRGEGETAQELMAASAKKYMQMMFAVGLIEGNTRKAEKAIDAADVSELDGVIAALNESAQADVATLMGKTK